VNRNERHLEVRSTPGAGWLACRARCSSARWAAGCLAGSEVFYFGTFNFKF